MKRKDDTTADKLLAALKAAAPQGGATMLELARQAGVSLGTVGVYVSLLRRSGVAVRQRYTGRTGAGSYGQARRTSETQLLWVEGE